MRQLVKKSWLSPQTAYAGHGDIEIDPSRVADAVVESLTNPIDQDFGTTSSNHSVYCQTHYLVAAATAESVVPTLKIREMTNRTLYLEGAYSVPETETACTECAEVAVPFIVETNLAWGNIAELLDEAERPTPLKGWEPLSGIEIESDNIQINIQRELATIFTGIDFATLSAQEVEMAILRNIAEQTTFIVSFN